MQNIAIITGGNSSEYQISVKSAGTIADNIDTALFKAYIVNIQGIKWEVTSNDINSPISISKDDFSFIHNNRKITFDKVIIAIHGTPGEDGRLQGYFDMLGIPYVSSGVLTSSLTFDKHYSKLFAQIFNMDTAPWIYLQTMSELNTVQVENEIGIPCFVKPANAGSSFGVTKVENIEQLNNAVASSIKEDSNGVIIEKFIEGREFTCGVLITEKNEYVFPVTEIVSKNDFFDFEAKYTVGMADEIVPAHIPEQLSDIIKEQSLKIYKALNCQWFCRVDYIYQAGTLYFLEINTIPGMSAESIVPKMINASAYTLKQLITEILQ